MTSKKHIRGGQMIGEYKYKCTLCDVPIKHIENVKHHVGSKSHISKLKEDLNNFVKNYNDDGVCCSYGPNLDRQKNYDTIVSTDGTKIDFKIIFGKTSTKKRTQKITVVEDDIDLNHYDPDEKYHEKHTEKEIENLRNEIDEMLKNVTDVDKLELIHTKLDFIDSTGDELYNDLNCIQAEIEELI
jgi:hypothetical protein